MVLKKLMNGALSRFKSDEKGSFSMIWAVSAAVLLGAMGAALDYALLSSANSRAQAVADTTALSAAIYVRNNGTVPTDRAMGLIGDYTAAELGYNFKNWVIDGGNGVSVNVTYDEVNKEAVVTTIGKTRPLFMQLFGHTELGFNAETVVKFEDKQPLDPASIVLVMDNSGSMFFDDIPLQNGIAPTEANIRMDGLKSAANNFMTQLNDLIGPQVESPNVPRVLRTGMITFDTAPRTDAPMDWGVVSEGIINNMQPRGGTDSSLPLDRAADWLNGTGSTHEPKMHEDENPNADPLKYLILMTDGRNTVGDEEWVQRDGTQNWRRFVTGRPTPDGLDEVTSQVTQVSPPVCTTNTVSRWYRMCHLSFPNGFNQTLRLGPWSFDPGNSSGTTNSGITFNCNSQEEETEAQTCTPAQFQTTYSGYEYFLGVIPPQGDWQEGEFDIESNIAARAECDELHNEGVEIFSIGFALEPGQYETNAWANRNGGFTPFPPNVAMGGHEAYDHSVAVKNANIAQGLLQYCANRDENFIAAGDTSALEEAFEKIGNTIVKEIIRIDS